MGKKDWFVTICFIVALIVRPVSYDKVIKQHKIYPQENPVLVNSSSISNQSNGLGFLTSSTTEIVLAKDTNGSPFVVGFTPPLPQHQSGTTGGLGRQSPSGSGGGSNGSEPGSCLSDATPRAAPKLGQVYVDTRSQPKTREEKAREKAKQELVESMEEEDKLNEQRKKSGKKPLTLTIKDGVRLFAENDQLRDKFHHAPELNSPLPPTLSTEDLMRLSKPNLYEERLATFRDREILPEIFVEQHGRDLRFAIISPDTVIKKGTFGANIEARGGPKKIPGYIAYNSRTGFCAFFDQNGNKYRTGFVANESQKTDIDENSNLM